MDTFRDRVIFLLKDRGISQAEASRRAGFKNAAFMSDIVRGHKVGVNAANVAALAKALSTSQRYLLLETNDPRPADAVLDELRDPISPGKEVDGPLHYRPLPVIVDSQNRIPLFASAEGGEGSMIISADEIDRVPRPYTLEHVKDAYAILIEGESMDPAFEPGDIAWVNPLLGGRRNHDVILYGGDRGSGGDARALIKRVVSSTDVEWTVKQYNPARQFKLLKHEWPVCHRVVGKLSKR